MSKLDVAAHITNKFLNTGQKGKKIAPPIAVCYITLLIVGVVFDKYCIISLKSVFGTSGRRCRRTSPLGGRLATTLVAAISTVIFSFLPYIVNLRKFTIRLKLGQLEVTLGISLPLTYFIMCLRTLFVSQTSQRPGIAQKWFCIPKVNMEYVNL